MPKEDRDKTKDVGSGRRRISRDDKGKLSKEKDQASEATHPNTTNEIEDK